MQWTSTRSWRSVGSTRRRNERREAWSGSASSAASLTLPQALVQEKTARGTFVNCAWREATGVAVSPAADTVRSLLKNCSEASKPSSATNVRKPGEQMKSFQGPQARRSVFATPARQRSFTWNAQCAQPRSLRPSSRTKGTSKHYYKRAYAAATHVGHVPSVTSSIKMRRRCNGTHRSVASATLRVEDVGAAYARGNSLQPASLRHSCTTREIETHTCGARSATRV